ncbi:MAG: TIM44-like domain-containing protein [Spirochaetes bacterium]|nr:TIM44-like domain-containing protein [Spirochaetota bacterium]
MKKLRKTHITIILAVAAVLVLTAVMVYARAGGAGDFDTGGGGGDDGIGFLIQIVLWIIMELPFPWNLIVSGVVIVVFVVGSKMTAKKVKAQTILNRLPTGDTVKKAPGRDAFMRNNPDFNEEIFIGNVKDAFMKIQKAWESQDLSPVRRFISDGVYRRFNTQFVMMGLLKQKNVISRVDIKNVYIDRIDSDGLYDIIQAAIHASITESFTSALDPSLNTGGTEEFVEYWSFLKKRGKPRKDIYQSDSCPNCGAPLPKDLGEVSKCASCGTLTNSGEYDWVLSEITQADDYTGANPKLGLASGLTEKVRLLIDENEDFAVQLIEDKASNAYLQMLTAQALGDPAIMRRFVSDDVFNKLPMPEPGARIAFNRLYLNDVYLVGVAVEEDKNVLAVAVKASCQRVKIDGGKAVKLDQAVISRTEVILMSRDRKAGASKGSLYAHSCPSCGAPMKNSLSINCAYCGTPFNSTANEWIVTGIMPMEQYEEYRRENADTLSYQVKASQVDRLYDVRDFAFNNMMLVLAADGDFGDEERRFAEELAKKWGYDREKLEPFFQMARSGRLSLRMPDDTKKRLKIYRMMEKAAGADRTVSPEERLLLENVRTEFKIDTAA